MEVLQLLGLLSGALLAGFVNGFAGFGTALFASGIWFAVLPFEVVPPLVVISALTGQVTGLLRLRRHLSFIKAWPFISGGILGVPLGTAILFLVSPDLIKAFIAVLLIGYALWQMTGKSTGLAAPLPSKLIDRSVGFGGGVLGGLAGLSGPLPIIWCQLQALSATEQRARYQPFNLVILALSLLSMMAFGMVTAQVMLFAVIAVPATVISSLIGVWSFQRTSESDFKTWILRLLLISGLFILFQLAT